MGRFMSVLLGLALLAGAVGVFSYRLSHDPGALGRYSWIAGKNRADQQTPESLEATRPQAMQRNGGDREINPYAGPGRSEARRRPDGRSRNDEPDTMKMFELGLDIANILVGLIGIYLTVGGMRARHQVST